MGATTRGAGDRTGADAERRRGVAARSRDEGVGAAVAGDGAVGAATGPGTTRPAAFASGTRIEMAPSGAFAFGCGQSRKASIAETKARQQSAATISEPPAPKL